MNVLKLLLPLLLSLIVVLDEIGFLVDTWPNPFWNNLLTTFKEAYDIPEDVIVYLHLPWEIFSMHKRICRPFCSVFSLWASSALLF